MRPGSARRIPRPSGQQLPMRWDGAGRPSELSCHFQRPIRGWQRWGKGIAIDCRFAVCALQKRRRHTVWLVCAATRRPHGIVRLQIARLSITGRPSGEERPRCGIEAALSAPVTSGHDAVSVLALGRGTGQCRRGEASQQGEAHRHQRQHEQRQRQLDGHHQDAHQPHGLQVGQSVRRHEGQRHGQDHGAPYHHDRLDGVRSARGRGRGGQEQRQEQHLLGQHGPDLRSGPRVQGHEEHRSGEAVAERRQEPPPARCALVVRAPRGVKDARPAALVGVNQVRRRAHVDRPAAGGAPKLPAAAAQGRQPGERPLPQHAVRLQRSEAQRKPEEQQPPGEAVVSGVARPAWNARDFKHSGERQRRKVDAGHSRHRDSQPVGQRGRPVDAWTPRRGAPRLGGLGLLRSARLGRQQRPALAACLGLHGASPQRSDHGGLRRGSGLARAGTRAAAWPCDEAGSHDEESEGQRNSRFRGSKRHCA
mmetsp:Transcript_8197/g.32302  ORF Transcript_8197/g.32302 Transcript_8197/m.32302 type:complete len:478 (+) Transcript_8197:704-2137(+)